MLFSNIGKIKIQSGAGIIKLNNLYLTWARVGESEDDDGFHLMTIVEIESVYIPSVYTSTEPFIGMTLAGVENPF